MQENENREQTERQFNNLTSQINELRKDSRIILTGDFNAKLKINKNHVTQEESNNGKLFSLLMQETNTNPTSLASTKGNWTRVNRNQPNERSVIDYVITENNDHIIEKLEIDDDGRKKNLTTAE